MTNKAGSVSGAITKLVTARLTGEPAAFNPTYRGVGEVVLEPSFGHFLMLRLENEALIGDKGALWIAPTQAVYDRLSTEGLGALTQVQSASLAGC